MFRSSGYKLFGKLANSAYKVDAYITCMCTGFVVEFFSGLAQFAHVAKNSDFSSDCHIQNI